VIPLRRKLTAIAEQRQADDAASVLEHATENERAELTLSSLAGAYVKYGFTLADLVDSAVSDEKDSPPLEYDPDALAAVTARISVRQELRLPKRECVVRKPPPETSHCVCLREALDAAVTSGQPLTRDEVLKAARQAHGERWAWLKRKPEPRPELPAPDPSPPPVPERKPKPAPPRELVSQTNTRPAQIVRRRKRWYDVDAPRPSDFRDMQF
jgi:hypothetical protein